MVIFHSYVKLSEGKSWSNLDALGSPTFGNFWKSSPKGTLGVPCSILGSAIHHASTKACKIQSISVNPQLCFCLFYFIVLKLECQSVWKNDWRGHVTVMTINSLFRALNASISALPVAFQSWISVAIHQRNMMCMLVQSGRVACFFEQL